MSKLPSVTVKPVLMKDNVLYFRQLGDGSQPLSTTLVLLWGYFGANADSIEKYSNLYHLRGFDVLFIPSAIKQFAWPKASIHLSRNVLGFLQSVPHYTRYLVHAFSMGAYNFTICLKMMRTDKTFQGLSQRLCCIVYDSLTVGSVDKMCKGVSMGAFRNSVVQYLLYKAISAYFCVTYEHSVKIHNFYLATAKAEPLEQPTLVFMCKNDPLSDWEYITDFLEFWKRVVSIPVHSKCWDKSKHAAHLLVHKSDYLQTINAFLDKYVPNEPQNSKL